MSMDAVGWIEREPYDNDKHAARRLRQGSAHRSVDSFGDRRLGVCIRRRRKVGGTAQMVELFDKVGLGQWFRYLTGLLEVAGGIGLLIPRYAFYAAILLVIVMIGAIITHVAVVGGSPAPAASLFVLSGIIAWLRKP